MSTVIQHPFDLLDIEPGTHFGYSNWMLIEQDRINSFADATGDHQWIHVDEEKARHGPFGKTIAHGCMTSSLAYNFLMEVIEVHGCAMALNYGTNKVRFPSAVPVMSKIRGGCEMVSAHEVKGAIQVVIRVTIELEGGDRPACVVDTISLFYPE